MPIIASAKAEANSSLTTWSVTMRLSAFQSQWSLKIHLSNFLQTVRLLTGCSVLHVPLQQTLHTVVSDMPGVRVPSVSCVWQHPESCYRHSEIWTCTPPHSYFLLEGKQLVPSLPTALVQVVGSIHCTTLALHCWPLCSDIGQLVVSAANIYYLNCIKLVQNLCSDPRYYH